MHGRLVEVVVGVAGVVHQCADDVGREQLRHVLARDPVVWRGPASRERLSILANPQRTLPTKRLSCADTTERSPEKKALNDKNARNREGDSRLATLGTP